MVIRLAIDRWANIEWGDKWLTVFAFTLPYLYEQEAKHGVFVLMTWIFRKWFPGLLIFLPDLLVGHTYQGLDVCIDWPELPEGDLLVCRSCQCGFRRAPQLPRLGEPQNLVARDPPFEHIIVKGKMLRLPLWVTRASQSLCPSDIRDRRRSPTPYHYQVRADAMAQPPHRTSCRTNPRRVHAFTELVGAIKGCEDFLKQMVWQIQKYEGDAGVARTLARHWWLYERCFDFQSLVSKEPTQAALDAFSELWKMTQPEVQDGLRPPKEWGNWGELLPNDPPQDLYLALASRLQCVWQNEVKEWEAAGQAKRSWLAQDHVLLSSVMSGFPPVNKLWSATRLPFRVAILLSRFGAWFTWRAPIKALQALTSPAANMHALRYPCRSFRTGHPSYQSGHLAGFAFANHTRIVVVVDPQLHVCRLQVAQDLEQDRALSDGLYGVIRVWHRERRRGINEAPAESWCGQLGYLWDPVQGLMTGPLIDRLHLRSNGFRGTLADEEVVEKVASAFHANPFYVKRHEKKMEMRTGLTATQFMLQRAHHVPSVWLHTPIGRACTRSVKIHCASVDSWAQTARLAHATYDQAELSVPDIKTLTDFAGANRPSLPDIAMNKFERGKHGKAVTLASKSWQVFRRRRQLESMAMPKAATSKIGIGKALAKGRGKALAKGRGKALAKASGKALAKAATSTPAKAATSTSLCVTEPSHTGKCKAAAKLHTEAMSVSARTGSTCVAVPPPSKKQKPDVPSSSPSNSPSDSSSSSESSSDKCVCCDMNTY